MKQIANWVFGSFFRTIGRLLVFVALGFIIAHFVDFGNLIDNFKITDLFFDKVDALTITTEVQKIGDTWWEPTNPNYEAEQSFFTWTVGKGENIQEFSIFARTNGNPIQTASADFIEFSMIIGIPQDITLTNQEQIDYDYCHRWNCTTFTANGSCQVFTCNQLYENTDTTTHYTAYQYTFDNTSMWIRVYYEGGGWNSCSIDNGQVTCPTNNKNIDRFTVQILFNPTRSSSIKLGIGKGINLYKKVNITGAIEQNTQAVESQTQQQQQQHQEIMDTNMTETNETASSFFDSFEDSDVGGLSGIITAPLVMINKMLDGVCVQPSATWKGATISLPCGDMLWSRTGASDLKNLVNVFYGGFICYYAIRKLFMMIEGLKDPTQDKIEVTDL